MMMMKVILLQGQRARAVGKVGCGVGEASTSVSMAQVRGAVTVMALLGVTWVSGALAIGPIKVALQYVFCVCNSLQGFVIFIVRVIQYPEARLSLKTLVKTGRTRIRSTHSFSNSHVAAGRALSSKSSSEQLRSSRLRHQTDSPASSSSSSSQSQTRNDLSYVPVPTAK